MACCSRIIYLKYQNIYLQRDGLGEVGLMNEVGALTVKSLRCSELYKMSEKEWNEKCGETKVLKREGMLGKGVGALKDGGL